MTRRDWLRAAAFGVVGGGAAAAAARARLQAQTRISISRMTRTVGPAGGGGARTLLQNSDFTLVGMFRGPSQSAVNSGLPNLNMGNASGLSHYYNGSQLRMFSSAFLPSVSNPMRVYEYIVPARANWTMNPATCPVATVPSTPAGGYWGDLTSGRVSEGLGSLLYRDVSGEKRLYQVGGPGYSAAGGDATLPSVCYAVLNHGAGTATLHGPWGVNDTIASANVAMKQVNTGIVEVSDHFATTYLGGRKLVAGFGGYQSAKTNGPVSMGPSAYAIQESDFGTVAANGYLSGLPLCAYPFHFADHGTPTRFQRPGTFTGSMASDYDEVPPWGTMTGPPIPPAPGGANGGPFDPPWAPVGSTYYWSENDWAGQAGVFYDDGNKWGYLQFRTFCFGRNYYYQSELRCEAIRFYRFCIDPLDLAAVAAGTDTSDTPQAAWFATQETPELTPSSYDVDTEASPASSWLLNAPAGSVMPRGATVDYNGAFTTGKPLLFVSEAGMFPNGSPSDPLHLVYEMT